MVIQLARILVLVFVAAAALGVGEAGVARAAVVDVLVFEQTRIDVGPVSDGELVKRGFKFTNTSQRTVKLAIKHCSFCPKPDCDKEKLAPGESAVLVLELPTMGKHGDAEATADVGVSGVRDSSVRVTLAARVRPAVRVEPPHTNLTQVVQRDGASAAITILGRRKDFAIVRVECESPWVSAGVSEARKVEDLGEQCTEYEITYTLRPGLPLGEFQVKSAIHTNDPRRERVGYSIEGRVHGDLTSRPDHVTLPAARPRRLFTAEFDVLTRSGEALMPGEVGFAIKPMHGIESCVIDARMGDEPGVLRVVVSGRLPARVMPIFDMPVLVTLNKTGEVLEVPIRVNVRDDAS